MFTQRSDFFQLRCFFFLTGVSEPAAGFDVSNYAHFFSLHQGLLIDVRLCKTFSAVVDVGVSGAPGHG